MAPNSRASPLPLSARLDTPRARAASKMATNAFRFIAHLCVLAPLALTVAESPAGLNPVPTRMPDTPFCNVSIPYRQFLMASEPPPLFSRIDLVRAEYPERPGRIKRLVSPHPPSPLFSSPLITTSTPPATNRFPVWPCSFPMTHTGAPRRCGVGAVRVASIPPPHRPCITPIHPEHCHAIAHLVCRVIGERM